MAHIVHCRRCGKEINTDVEPGDSWLIPPEKTRVYYHTKCYNMICSINGVDDTHDPDDLMYWYEATYNFLHYIKKYKVDGDKILTDFKIGKKTGKRPKGIFLTTMYLYNVKKLSWNKANEHIGLVISSNSTVYKEATVYYSNNQEKAAKFIQEVNEMLEKMANQKKEVHTINRKKKKKLIDISEIEGMNE